MGRGICPNALNINAQAKALSPCKGARRREPRKRPPGGLRQPNWRWLRVRGFPGPVSAIGLSFFGFAR